MPDADPQRVTELLAAAQRGERRATDDLVAVLYDELKRVATSLLRGAGPGPVTLQSTALVNEAYLRLQGGRNCAWESRAHFFGAAARAMRQILIDRARSARVGKRSESAVESIALALDDGGEGGPATNEDMLALDKAMASLESRDSRQHDVVMLRFFAGLTVEQAAEVLDVSAATVKSDWSYARAWLLREVERARGSTHGDAGS